MKKCMNCGEPPMDADITLEAGDRGGDRSPGGRPVTVVNLHHQKCDIDISRRGRRGWGNPYPLAAGASELERQVVILRYCMHLLERPRLLARIGELRGQRLGCFCAPRACHGDVLATLAQANGDTTAWLRYIIEQRVRQLARDYTPAQAPELVVSGSRAATNYDLVRAALESAPFEIRGVLQGECPAGGVDRLAKRWGFEQRLIVRGEVADFRDRGARAGPERNARMLEGAQMFLALWDGKRHRSGTLNFIGQAHAQGDWIGWRRRVDIEDVIKWECWGVRVPFLLELQRL